VSLQFPDLFWRRNVPETNSCVPARLASCLPSTANATARPSLSSRAGTRFPCRCSHPESDRLIQSPSPRCGGSSGENRHHLDCPVVALEEELLLPVLGPDSGRIILGAGHDARPFGRRPRKDHVGVARTPGARARLSRPRLSRPCLARHGPAAFRRGKGRPLTPMVWPVRAARPGRLRDRAVDRAAELARATVEARPGKTPSPLRMPGVPRSEANTLALATSQILSWPEACAGTGRDEPLAIRRKRHGQDLLIDAWNSGTGGGRNISGSLTTAGCSVRPLRRARRPGAWQASLRRQRAWSIHIRRMIALSLADGHRVEETFARRRRG